MVDRSINALFPGSAESEKLERTSSAAFKRAQSSKVAFQAEKEGVFYEYHQAILSSALSSM